MVERPVPPYATDRVEVDETAPPIAWSGPVSEPIEALPETARFVVVAFVEVLFTAVKFCNVVEPVKLRLVRKPVAPRRVVAKKFVVVALVPVALTKVKF